MKRKLAAAFLGLASALLIMIPLASPASAHHAAPDSVCTITVNLAGDEVTTMSGTVASNGHNCVPSAVPFFLRDLVSPAGIECGSFIVVPVLGVDLVFAAGC